MSVVEGPYRHRSHRVALAALERVRSNSGLLAGVLLGVGVTAAIPFRHSSLGHPLGLRGGAHRGSLVSEFAKMPHGFVVALRSFETARTQWHLISACSISRVVGRRYLGDQLGVASGVRMSEMNKSTRLVFHIGGYKLRSPMSAHRRFIQELRRFEKTWSVQATPSECQPSIKIRQHGRL